MANGPTSNLGDQQVAKLAASRNRPAVSKARLALVRSALPNCVIFVFEGDSDKSVYSQWVRRVRAGFTFEPFPCNGKTQLFQLRDVLGRDLGGLEAGVYFFVDRDFDDLGGRAPTDNTFMTDRYSIENYLVDPLVMDELLKNEFHCHGRPILRKELSELLQELLDQFLDATKEINFRLYAARQLGIDVVGGLPKKAKDIAAVALLGVSRVYTPVDQIIVLARDPTADEINKLRPAFDALDARARYRGKFSFMFFIRWLDLLATDRARDTPILFKSLDKRKTVKLAEVSGGLLATLSPLPQGFEAFVQAAAGPQ